MRLRWKSTGHDGIATWMFFIDENNEFVELWVSDGGVKLRPSDIRGLIVAATQAADELDALRGGK